MTSRSISISVIVPVYNANRYIGACVESILAQSFTDFELILVNDGSSDDSGVLCDRYAAKDARIRVIHTVNCGVSSARNTGLAAAAGKWIAFVDADDTVEVDYLKNLYRGVELCGDITSAIVLSGFKVRSRDNGAVREEVCWVPAVVGRPNIPSIYLQRQLYRRAQPFSKLYNRSVIESHGMRFDPEIRYGEDLLFFIEYLGKVDTLVLCAECDYNYYQAVGSGLSKSYSSFSAEFKLYKRFVSLSNSLLAETTKDFAMLTKEESFLMRAVSCLYRKNTREQSRKRREILRDVVRETPRDYPMSGIGAKLLKRGAVVRFDVLYAAAFGIRYSGFGRWIWHVFCKFRWALGR